MITDAELAAMKAQATIFMAQPYEGSCKQDLAQNQLRLLREVEELRAALRDARNEALEEAARMHEQLYVAHDDAMTAIVKYRDAIRAIKARAALGDT